jgi:hypothetical protein
MNSKGNLNPEAEQGVSEFSVQSLEYGSQPIAACNCDVGNRRSGSLGSDEAEQASVCLVGHFPTSVVQVPIDSLGRNLYVAETGAV